ncbi:MAG: electron transfer flavoprotein subunit beta [Deltaproteobacteria bacterium]|nr:MAG: electron transfer flavoprotein subunit beta [Deltaproteobacteria bacterium]
MNIIVCIKQVPDVAEVKWDENGSLIRTGLPSIINPNDKHAIEAALTLKDTHGGTVTVLSMGPPQVESALREALGMGCDQAILLTDRKFGGADCWATAYTLGLAIKKVGAVDMVITGVEAMDGNTAQVGPEIADFLGLPLCSYALDISCEDGKVTVLQNMGEVVRELEAPLPCLITAEKELNDPRIPPMDMLMEAYEKDIITWGMDDLDGEAGNFGLKGSPTRLRKVFTPKRVKGKVEILEGDPAESARKLVEKLKEHNLI